MGKYHGRWGFEAFTNARGVLYHSPKIDPGVKYPPYSEHGRERKVMDKMLSGTTARSVPSLSLRPVRAGVVIAAAATSTAAAATIDGTVVAAGRPSAGAVVGVYAGSPSEVARVGETTTGSDGGVWIAYTPPAYGIVYADATGAASAGRLRLAAVIGIAGGDPAEPQAAKVTINEFIDRRDRLRPRPVRRLARHLGPESRVGERRGYSLEPGAGRNRHGRERGD